MAINALKNKIKPICVAALTTIFAACGSSTTDPHHTFDDNGAKVSAQDYYQLLIDRKTKEYIKSVAAADTMDAAMYNQLVDLMDQYLAHEDEVHHGLKKAIATGDSLSHIDSLATVFLDVTYGDSTTEHIYLPLRFHNNTWRIK